MKYLGFALALLSVCSSSPGQDPKPATPAPASARQPVAFPRSEERFITSKNGQEYRILISYPAGPAPTGRHPVVYLLDGDDFLPLSASILQVLAGGEKASLHNGITPGILVGIGYRGKSGRNIDYTPDAPKGTPETYVDGRPYPPQENGGADRFYDFLQNELKPAIEKDYRIDRSRQVLFGNGYGGLFALHVLFTKPDSFQTYVASSPSVWWNDRYILKEEAAFTERFAANPVKCRLIMSVGDNEQSLTEHEYSLPDKVREEHSSKVSRRRMVDNTRELHWRLQKLAPKGFTSVYQVFPGQSHKSVMPLAVSHALPLVFPPTPAQP